MKIPYKFAKGDVEPLETLKGDTIYTLYEKRYKLTQKEKDILFAELQTNSYSRKGIPRAGWMFPFEEILKSYIVKIKYYGFQEVFAANKTSIRKYYKSHCLEIITH